MQTRIKICPEKREGAFAYMGAWATMQMLIIWTLIMSNVETQAPISRDFMFPLIIAGGLAIINTIRGESKRISEPPPLPHCLDNADKASTHCPDESEELPSSPHPHKEPHDKTQKNDGWHYEENRY